MLNTNKYWSTLLGVFAEVLIGKQVEYTAHATYNAFVDSAADGEFGFFNANTLALIPGSVTATADTVEIFAAVKRGTVVETTNKFRKADYKISKAAYAAPVLQVSTATLTGGAIVTGHAYGIKIVETTPGYQPFPTWYYEVVAAAGETATTLGNKLIALINDAASLINKDSDPVVTAANAAGVLTITAKSAGITFRIAFSADAIADLGAVAAYTTPGKLGNGTYEQVLGLEEVSDVYKGVTTNYPLQGANPSDFGKPSSNVVVGGTYDIYVLAGFRTEASPTPLNQHQHKHHIVLAVPSNGAANPTAEVAFALGV